MCVMFANLSLFLHNPISTLMYITCALKTRCVCTYYMPYVYICVQSLTSLLHSHPTPDIRAAVISAVALISEVGGGATAAIDLAR